MDIRKSKPHWRLATLSPPYLTVRLILNFEERLTERLSADIRKSKPHWRLATLSNGDVRFDDCGTLTLARRLFALYSRKRLERVNTTDEDKTLSALEERFAELQQKLLERSMARNLAFATA